MIAYEADSATAKSWEPREVTWEEIEEWVQRPAREKECGGYVFGRFKGKHRRHEDLIDKPLIALDFDKKAEEVRVALAEQGVKAVLHSTWNHAPDDHRYRVLVPTDRPVLPEEYERAAESLAQRLRAPIDRTCLRPTQFMWKPSTQNPEWYTYDTHTGPPVSVDELLETYDADLAVASFKGPGRLRKQDPFQITGIVGAFNRAHLELEPLIEEFGLPYVSEGPRFRYEHATSVAGMDEVAPGIFYSHHATDPAGLQALTAFDLVRIHMFSHLDTASRPGTPVNRLPSYSEMQDYAATESCTKRAILDDAFKEPEPEPEPEPESWREKLTFDKHGRVSNSVQNRDLLAENDPEFGKLAFSELLETRVATAALPWDAGKRNREVLSRFDLQQFAAHVERTYGLTPGDKLIDAMVYHAAMKRRFNPVQTWLNGLVWDGRPRLETCLPGVQPTDYTRLVARKIMVGAVARAMTPGCKMDHCLVLYGPEGRGKTRWAYAYARSTEWISTLERIDRKDTLITMNRSWFVLSDEVEALKRADFEALKSFLTKTHDNYRTPYEIEDTAHPRRCIIIATTNDPRFLRRQQGNRRFHVVSADSDVDEGTLTPTYVDQVWAEAVVLWRAGEQLFLTDEEEALARAAREGFTQAEPLIGQVQEYLDMPVPDDWDSSSPTERHEWFTTNRFFSDDLEGRQTTTCAMAIWREVLGNDKGTPMDRDAARISQALDEADGWFPAGVQRTIYGPQQVYVRYDDVL